MTRTISMLRFRADEMTRAEPGKQVGVTRQTITAIEAGKFSPTREYAFRIAKHSPSRSKRVSDAS